MKYVPSLPPPRIIGLGDNLTLTGPAALKAAKVVQPRSLPPLVVPPHGRLGPERDAEREVSPEPAGEAPERRHDAHAQGERRTYCRRVWHLPVLIELRAELERRRHKQRAVDPTEHIDIQA